MHWSPRHRAGFSDHLPELVQLQHAVSDHLKAVMDKKELFLPVLLLSDIPGLFTCFFLTDSRNFHRKTHIIKSSSLHEQIKMLEDHSYILTLLTEFFSESFVRFLPFTRTVPDVGLSIDSDIVPVYFYPLRRDR